MTSTIKVNNIQNQCGTAYIERCGTTITLGTSGDNITLACGATQTGFGRTGTVDWDTTAKTASFTAVSGNGYFVNTTSGAITATLPAGSAGAIVSFADYAATWQTNNLTVSPDGTDKIGGVNSDVTLSTEGQSVTFVYTDSTQGWINTMDSTSNVRGNPYIIATGGTETTCGDYKIHTFTGPGTFCVSATAACAADNNVDYMVVAGGGGGAFGGGGGGAGGFRESAGTASGCYTTSPLGACVSALPISVTAYPITVGGGGTGGTNPSRTGGNGSNSVFSTITSTAGGYGENANPNPGGPGGSGGGAGGEGTTGTGGSGNTPPVSPPQGNNGGDAQACGVSGNSGGGGATAAGTAPAPNTKPGTPGGAGATTSISGSSTAYAGGGGGGAYVIPSGTGGTGGIGGGGPGSSAGGDPAPNRAGTANTGGGGGGGSTGSGSDGGTGGSGIVIIRYKFQ